MLSASYIKVKSDIMNLVGIINTYAHVVSSVWVGTYNRMPSVSIHIITILFNNKEYVTL